MVMERVDVKIDVLRRRRSARQNRLSMKQSSSTRSLIIQFPTRVLQTKKYIGLSKNKFRERYNHHKWSFSIEDNNPFNSAGRKDKAQNTTLSSHIWKLKKKRLEFDMKWRIINQAPAYSKESGSCQLCLEEKYQIMFADKSE